MVQPNAWVEADEAANPFLQRLQALPRLTDLPYRHTCVSLFCGGGGLDLGLALAGFDIRFASDIERVHCKTIEHNFPDCAASSIDINDLKGSMVAEATATKSFGLLAGGPPCQAFSILGKRSSFDDPRGRLVYEYARLVKEIGPKAFVFENVPGLLTVDSGRDWKELLAYFEADTRYKLHWKVLNAADFGVPQIRRRLFIVGFQDRETRFTFPEETHVDPRLPTSLLTSNKKPWLPAKWALEDVDGLPNQRIRPHGDRVRERYSRVAQGGRDTIDHTDRIHPDRPSGTVLVGSRAGGGRPHIHPVIPRHITVREAARLQSFPDWYVLQGTETWQYRAVGNAVPVLLAKAVGDSIAQALERQY